MGYFLDNGVWPSASFSKRLGGYTKNKPDKTLHERVPGRRGGARSTRRVLLYPSCSCARAHAVTFLGEFFLFVCDSCLFRHGASGRIARAPLRLCSSRTAPAE